MQKRSCRKFLTRDCLPPQNCQQQRLFLVPILVGIGYVLIFMYLDKIAKLISAILIPRMPQMTEVLEDMLNFSKSKFLKTFGKINKMEYLANDVVVDDAEIQQHCAKSSKIEVLSDQQIKIKYRHNVVSHKDSSSSMFPGFLKILIFFHQTMVLFKIQTDSESHTFVHILQELLSFLFNLRVDGIFTQDLSWCPVDNLRPVSKVLLKNAFILYLFALVTLVYAILKMGKAMNIINTESYVSSKSRLLSCTIRLILVSYAGITTSSFSLLSCVHLGPLGNVLFIDGSIKCYNQWQIVVILILILWVFPFPISIYTSSQLLRHQMLTPGGFLLSLLFPIPAIFHWLHLQICCCKKTAAESKSFAVKNKC